MGPGGSLSPPPLTTLPRGMSVYSPAHSPQIRQEGPLQAFHITLGQTGLHPRCLTVKPATISLATPVYASRQAAATHGNANVSSTANTWAPEWDQMGNGFSCSCLAGVTLGTLHAFGIQGRPYVPRSSRPQVSGSVYWLAVRGVAMGFLRQSCGRRFCDSIGRDSLCLTASISSLMVLGQQGSLLMSERLKQGGNGLAHQGEYYYMAYAL
ncbi:hypothetical protein ACSS6W_001101 [Trichoderma asperelloides]